MKRKRKYPYPFPHLEFACLFVDVFQRISGVLYYRFILFKFHGLTTTFYVSLFKNSAQKILQRIIHVRIFLPSTPHDFFLMFSKHALLFRRRGNHDVFLQTRNTHFKLYYYVITFQRRDGYRVNHVHTRYVHTCHEHSSSRVTEMVSIPLQISTNLVIVLELGQRQFSPHMRIGRGISGASNFWGATYLNA